MRPLLAALVVSLALAFAIASVVVRPAAAGEPDESIRAVIEDQLAAFRRNDLAAAFGHASPALQAIFRSPENFGRMVATGYPMIWRSARHEVQGLRETPAGLVQIVLFEDGAGHLFEAAYLMVQVDGAWRIAGVELSAMPGVGV